MSGEHHEAAEPLSHPVLLRHSRRKPGFAALFVVGADRVIGTDFPYEIVDADGTIAIPLLQQLRRPNVRKFSGKMRAMF